MRHFWNEATRCSECTTRKRKMTTQRGESLLLMFMKRYAPSLSRSLASIVLLEQLSRYLSVCLSDAMM